MRHHKKARVFGREKSQRTALIKSLALSLVENGKIRTTEAKAKEVRPFVERLITKAKNDTLANRRILISRLGSESGVSTLVKDVASKYKTRAGGYTRITKLPQRLSDGAKMAVIEFV
jgi:large subunit ribosomal protein L17